MRYFLSFVVLLLLGSLVSACKDVGPGDSANADAHRELLASVADNVIIPITLEFVTATTDLHVAVTVYEDSLTDADRDQARARWTGAMAIWQQAELLQVGPAGLMGDIAGGKSLRDGIYSWPTVNTCRVDQETARAGYLIGLDTALPNVRGLDALEYLLFNENPGHTCSAGSAFATGGQWAALGAEETVKLRRADHASALAADLMSNAQKLRDAWDPITAGSFRTPFATAGKDTSVYATAQEGLNALTDAMFYVEKETKDMKLAVPAGIIDCVETTCPDARESRVANLSKDHIVANLEGFRRIFTGGKPGDTSVGFDDLLESMGQGSLAGRLTTELDAAITAVAGLQGTLLEALANTPQAVVSAYDAVRIPIQTFRTEVLSVLDLELPQRAEGDND